MQPDPFAHLTLDQRARLAAVQSDARTRALLLRPSRVAAAPARRRSGVDATVQVSGLIVTLCVKGMRVHSEANERGHWSKRHTRDKAVREVLLGALAGVEPPKADRWRVTLVREGKNLVDLDNLAGGFKRHRDTIAAWLGTDDGPKAPVVWEYQQRRGRGYNVTITVKPE